MKVLINKAMHTWAQLVAPKVSRTEVEQQYQMGTSEDVRKQLLSWRGKGDFTLISLGQNCSTAWYLKETGQRKAAYPFDWVATSPEIIQHCLSDRFGTFLNRESIIPRGVRAGHSVYHAGFFGHRNPHSISSDLRHYEKCVHRFLQQMDGARPVIFVTTVLNEWQKRPVWADGFVNNYERPERQSLKDFTAMMTAFTELNPNARFVFLEEYTESDFRLEVTQMNEQSVWIVNSLNGRSSGVLFLDGVDDRIARSVYSGLA